MGKNSKVVIPSDWSNKLCVEMATGNNRERSVEGKELSSIEISSFGRTYTVTQKPQTWLTKA